jgi:uncharacterized membrane protein YgaE (UPF0421/DUF939 family)
LIRAADSVGPLEGMCMEYKENNSLHAIGMRNIKTALAVLVVLLLYQLLHRETTLLAATAAIICMQDSVEKTLRSGLNRLVGTSAGALIGMLLLYCRQALGGNSLSLLFVPLGIVLIIWFCNFIQKQEATVISCIVLLIIMLEQSPQNPFIYSVNRMLDTLFGIVVAFVINRYICNPSQIDQKGEEP